MINMYFALFMQVSRVHIMRTHVLFNNSARKDTTFFLFSQIFFAKSGRFVHFGTKMHKKIVAFACHYFLVKVLEF